MSNETITALLAQSPVAIQGKSQAEVSLSQKVSEGMQRSHVSRVRTFIKGTMRDAALFAAFNGAEDAQERATAYFEFAHSK